jgi:branched-chain amino acid transport system permease protein
MTESSQKRGGIKTFGLAAVVLLPLFFLPILLPTGWLSLATEMVILAVAACGLNLMLGYAGMVSFGPAGLYAVGAYSTALILYYTKVPFGLAFIAGPIAAALASAVIGWFCVRLTQVYFALLTLAFSQIIHTIVFEWYAFTRGDDGIVDIKIPALLNTIPAYYYFSLAVACACIGLMWRIVNSPFGKTLQALRENPGRTESVGIHVRRYQLTVFVLSGTFLGVAGSLFCGFNKNVFPAYAHWMKSTEMLVVCLLGGIHNFLGPLVGSVVFIFLDKLITSFTQYWPLVLGLVVLALLMFLQGGIAGFIAERIAVRRQRGGESV